MTWVQPVDDSNFTTLLQAMDDEQFNKILEGLGEDAVQSAYIPTEEEGQGMKYEL